MHWNLGTLFFWVTVGLLVSGAGWIAKNLLPLIWRKWTHRRRELIRGGPNGELFVTASRREDGGADLCVRNQNGKIAIRLEPASDGQLTMWFHDEVSAKKYGHVIVLSKAELASFCDEGGVLRRDPSLRAARQKYAIMDE